MLSDRDVQEFLWEGLTFNQLLLHVWPPLPHTRTHGKPRTSIDDIELAERIGVHAGTLKYWRLGQQVPAERTIRRVAPLLEAEFGVPEDIWLDAWRQSRGEGIDPHDGRTMDLSYWQRFLWNLERYRTAYGDLDVPSEYISDDGYHLGGAIRNVRTNRQFHTHRAELDAIGFLWSSPREGSHGPPRSPCRQQQYGWLQVVSEAPDRPYKSGYTRFVNALCLLCGELATVTFWSLEHGKVSSCQTCAGKLRALSAGQTGASYDAYSWRVQAMLRGKKQTKRGFRSTEDAERYADKITYEAYGHTIFLNFPDEYDQSNDPVFVPVGTP